MGKCVNVERKSFKNRNTWTVNSLLIVSKFAEGKWRLERCLEFILWIYEFIKNWSLLLTTHINRESMYCDIRGKFYIRGSVYRNSRLKKSNEMQQYANIYFLLNYSTRFGRPSRPSSGVHKTVVAASGTDHTLWGARFLHRDQISP